MTTAELRDALILALHDRGGSCAPLGALDVPDPQPSPRIRNAMIRLENDGLVMIAKEPNRAYKRISLTGDGMERAESLIAGVVS